MDKIRIDRQLNTLCTVLNLEVVEILVLSHKKSKANNLAQGLKGPLLR